MTSSQREHLEQRLLRERERAVRVMGRMDERARAAVDEDDGDLTRTPSHPADEGTDTMELEKDFLLMTQGGRLVYQIDEALRILYRRPAEYGICRGCGESIALERLDIVPWAELCLGCQRREEAGTPRAAA